jgi:hypothetical protein
LRQLLISPYRSVSSDNGWLLSWAVPMILPHLRDFV